MPADIIDSQMLPSKGQERITLMDDYGTEFQLFIPVKSGDRSQLITEAIAQQTANEEALENYARTYKIDISAHKQAGLSKKTPLLAKYKGQTTK